MEMKTLGTRLQPAMNIPSRGGGGGSSTFSITSCYSKKCCKMSIIFQVFLLFVFVYFSASIADFYSMSYLWFSGLSVLTSFVVGTVMSLILGKFTSYQQLISLVYFTPSHHLSWELKQTKTTTATKTSPNKRSNKQIRSCVRALQVFVHVFGVLCKTATWNDKVLRSLRNANDDFHLE